MRVPTSHLVLTLKVRWTVPPVSRTGITLSAPGSAWTCLWPGPREEADVQNAELPLLSRSRTTTKTGALSGRADSLLESMVGGGEEERRTVILVATAVPPAVPAAFWLRQ